MNIKSKPLSRVKFFVLFLVLFLFLVNLFSLNEYIVNSFLKATSPIKSAFWSQGISINKDNYNNYSFEKSFYLSEIASLKIKNQEIKDLRNALEIGLADEFTLEDVKVIGRSVESNEIIISKGKKNGIMAGMPVLTSSKSLVGEIVEVLPNFSFVKLLTHPELTFDAQIIGKDNSLGVIENNENLTLTMISRDANLELADIVVTYPGSGIYPGGIFIGEVSKVLKDDANVFQSVEIIPGFSPRNLNNLFVIIDF